MFKKNPILVASSVTALLLLIALAMAWLNGVSGLEQLRTELEAKGERLSWQKIAPKPPLGVSNGAFDLLPAINSIPRAPQYLFGQQFTPSGALISKISLGTLPVEINDRSAGGGREWISNMWDRVDPLVASHRSDWLNVERAATNQVIDLEHDWSKGFGLIHLHLAKLRYLCAWNEMAVVVDLRNRDFDSALSLQTNIFAVLNKFTVPTLLSQLLRIDCFNFLLKGTWESLQVDEFSDTQLAALQAAVNSVRFADEMLRAQEMERSMLITYWEQRMNDPSLVSSLGSSKSLTLAEKLTSQLWRVAVAHRDLAHYLTVYQPQIEAARNGFAVKSDLAFTSAIPALNPPVAPGIYRLPRGGMSFPEKSGITKTMRAETQRELAVTAIALKRHFQKHREYPKNLNGLVPEFLAALPVDWMDGKPLRYERTTPTSFRLWSIGTDHKDDGGDPSPLKPGQTRYWTDGIDLVWPARATPAEIKTFTNDRLKDWRKATAP